MNYSIVIQLDLSNESHLNYFHLNSLELLFNILFKQDFPGTFALSSTREGIVDLVISRNIQEDVETGLALDRSALNTKSKFLWVSFFIKQPLLQDLDKLNLENGDLTEALTHLVFLLRNTLLNERFKLLHSVSYLNKVDQFLKQSNLLTAT